MATQKSGRGRGESAVSERRIHATERARRAVELRLAGARLEEIAQTLGYRSASSAFYAIKSALNRTLQEPADELRKIEAARLDKINKALWTNAMRGDPKAIYPLMRVMSRRAKLLGLDAPVGYEGSDTGLLDELMREMRQQHGIDLEELDDVDGV